MRFQARALVQLSSVIDAVVVAAVFALVFPVQAGQPLGATLMALLLVPFWIGLLRYFGVYESQRLGGWTSLARKVASAHFVGLVVLCLVHLLARRGSYREILLFAATSFVLLTTEKTLAKGVLHRLRRRGLDNRNVLVIGSRETADEVHRSFQQHQAWGLRVAMVGEGPPEARTYLSYPDGLLAGDQLEEVLQAHVVDEVILSVQPETLAREQVTIHICERYGVLARITFGAIYGQPETTRAEEFCGTISFAVGPRRDAGLIAKRTVDLVLSVIFMVMALPVMAIVAIAVKLSSEGPVIFKQTRVGLRGRKFTMYKFRTMICGAEALMPTLASQTVMAGPIYKQFSDPRVTAAGRFLRKFSLDELPQLWNVFKGEMSLVGPRPLPVTESAAIAGEYRRRFSMRPGLTCFWQVNGRNNTEFSKWMNYDLQYVDRWSLMLDAKLLLQTIPVVFSGKGAY
jgi:exopolysaccharide biosynthesis polyprenyl glycosylphosphotransferase